MVKIHPTAIVDTQARLGENVEIGPFCIIEKDVVIGDNVVIGPRCTIHEGSSIANGCLLNEGVIIGMQPQDLKYNGEKTKTIIGENTQIRELASIERGTVTGHGHTTVGSSVLIMGYAHIAHDCQVGNNVILSHGVGLSGHVVVEDKVIIGGMTGVHQFCRIGKMAMIGGIAKVNKDVPPYLLVDGVPARAAGVNLLGLRRSGVSIEVRKEIKRAFKLLYREDLTVSHAIERIDKELKKLPEIIHLLAFLTDAGRGICAARHTGEGEKEDE